MKIKEEFDIHLVENTLDVYRLGKTSKLLQISEAHYKKEGKYVELNVKYPKNNISLLRSKTLNSDKITLASKGYTPKSQYFHLKIDRDKQSAVLRKVDSFYLFENKFSYLQTKTDKQKEGLQFRKIESREEIEHRKKNINYKIRNLESEEFRTLKFVDKSKDVIEELKCLRIEDRKKKDPKRNLDITKSIKNAVVVNTKDLDGLFGDSQAVRACLAKNTFYFNGRYILNNSFYSEDLQATRERILEILLKKGFILMSDISKDTFLIEELCTSNGTSPKYYLKGYPEEQDPSVTQFTSLVDNKVYDIIREKYFCTLSDIVNSSNLDADTVQKILFKEDIIAVGEGIYTIYDLEDPDNEIKQEIIKLIQNKKSYRKGEMNTAVDNISELLEVEKDTVQKYIEKVFQNKRGIWSIKETF